jgi:hypothetical protein
MVMETSGAVPAMSAGRSDEAIPMVESSDALDSLRAACLPMGKLEYVVQSRHHDDVQTWLVLRPQKELAPEYEKMGVVLSADCRVVVEAGSLRPVGVLPHGCPAAPSCAGFNPYFDLSPA